MARSAAAREVAFAPAAAVAPLEPPAAREDLAETLAGLGSELRFAAGQEIFGQGEAAEHVYRVLEGATRSYRLAGDGRRQITDFHFPGDVIGLEAGLRHSRTGEAIGPVRLQAVRRRALSRLAETDVGFAAQLWRSTVREHLRSQDHILVLGRQGARERVAGFLLALAARLDAPEVLDLPMSRQDIADYLGLTIHTVSRTFSHLQESGAVRAQGARRIRLADPDALAGLIE